MIRQIKYIQNVGRFEQVRAPADLTLDALTLLYSENGRGKTTLCAILRSLSSGDSSPILERVRLSATSEAKVVIDVDGTDAAFDGTAWSKGGPDLVVFDEHFVDANVHSGLSIEPGHRQNLHVLVIGEEGVRYQKRVEELGAEITTLQATVREKQNAITPEIRGGLTVDSFCDLQPVDDIDAKVADATKSVAVLRDAKTVQDTPLFASFVLPKLRADEIRVVLAATLPEIEQSAVAAVSAHVASLGENAEPWVSEGVEHQGDSNECPFCGQSTADVDLIAHYRGYFSEEYRRHKERIVNASAWLTQHMSGDGLAKVQRNLLSATERHTFWAKYVELPELELDVDQAIASLKSARDALLEALKTKAGSPLEPVVLSDEVDAAIAHYDGVAENIRVASEAMLGLNEAVSTAKEKAQHGSLPTAEAQLTRLKATQKRHEDDTAALCTAYADAKKAKAEREKEKEEARTALREHRDKVFGNYQAAINNYLVTFNADFLIEKLAPMDARGVPSSSYEFVVNKTAVATTPTDEPKPSFATVLSTGDRNTLALAFFFASLEARDSLDDVIVAIDDPASSLDDGRAFATVQEVRGLVGKAKQVIVLAHSSPILCQLWDGADKDATATIEIRNMQGVPDASTLESWDAESAAVTEYDRLHKQVRDYAETSTGQARDVAVALRFVLEGYLRVAFVDACPPGTLLGPFLTRAKQAEKDGSPILAAEHVEELDKLREYVNQFHHKTSKNWQENLSNINEKALQGYARRVIRFTRIAAA